MRFASVEYPTHELNANVALAGAGVALLSPSLFGSLLTEGLLIAPFSCVLRRPAWHFALMRAPMTPARRRCISAHGYVSRRQAWQAPGDLLAEETDFSRRNIRLALS